MNKFLIIDPFIHKEEHFIVDRAFLEYFSKFKSSVLVNKTLKEKSTDLELSFLPSFIDTDSKSNLVRWFYREFYKVIYTLLILLANVFTRRRVVFLAMSQFQFFVFGMVCWICRFKVSIVMHHYAETLIKPKPKRSISDKLFLTGYKTFDSLPDVRFLYLSKHIGLSIPENRKNFFINHPIPLNMINDTPLELVGSYGNSINIATIGLLSSSRKNSHLINELNSNNRVALWVIGRFAKNEEFSLKSDIKAEIWDGMYTSEDFRRAISKIDCFVYFFDKNQYRCTASGTLIDAILYNKFVISLDNLAAQSLLSNYNKKMFFDSIGEMRGFLDGISMEDLSRNDTNVDPRLGYCLVSPEFADEHVLKKWLC